MRGGGSMRGGGGAPLAGHRRDRERRDRDGRGELLVEAHAPRGRQRPAAAGRAHAHLAELRGHLLLHPEQRRLTRVGVLARGGGARELGPGAGQVSLELLRSPLLAAQPLVRRVALYLQRVHSLRMPRPRGGVTLLVRALLPRPTFPQRRLRLGRLLLRDRLLGARAARLAPRGLHLHLRLRLRGLRPLARRVEHRLRRLRRRRLALLRQPRGVVVLPPLRLEPLVELAQRLPPLSVAAPSLPRAAGRGAGVGRAWAGRSGWAGGEVGGRVEGGRGGGGGGARLCGALHSGLLLRLRLVELAAQLGEAALVPASGRRRDHGSR